MKCGPCLMPCSHCACSHNYSARPSYHNTHFQYTVVGKDTLCRCVFTAHALGIALCRLSRRCQTCVRLGLASSWPTNPEQRSPRICAGWCGHQFSPLAPLNMTPPSAAPSARPSVRSHRLCLPSASSPSGLRHEVRFRRARPSTKCPREEGGLFAEFRNV